MASKKYMALLGRSALDEASLRRIEFDASYANAAGLTPDDVRVLRSLHDATEARREAAGSVKSP